MTRPRLVVLASGNGSNLQALIDAVDEGHINGQIVAVVSDRPESRALTRATDAGILAAPLPIAVGERRDDYDRRLADLLSDLAPHLVVLAGWMRILTDTVVESFRVINLHPALPGELPGTRAIERAWAEHLAGGRDRSGVMVHEVPDVAVDAGPVLAVEEVAMVPGDDLDSFATRVHAVEHRLLTRVVAEICDDLLSHDHQEVIDA